MTTGESANPHGFCASDFARRGEIVLSSEAQSEARQFANDLRRLDPLANWIVAFTWCYKRTIRSDKHSEEIDEGPGIDLAGYKSSEIPSSAIEVCDGVPIVFIIPRTEIDKVRSKKVVQIRLASGRLSYALE